MVRLVLDDTRREIGGAQLEALATAIQCAHQNFPVARHAASDVRNAQASFPAIHDVRPNEADLGVDQDDRRRPRLLFVLVEVRHEQPQPLVHLRRRQPDAAILDHRHDHVVNELLNRRGFDLAGIERTSFRAQQRMPHARDLQDGHPGDYTGLQRDARGSRFDGSRHAFERSAEAELSGPILHPHDDAHSYRFCPRCGGTLEQRLLKATEPQRLVCVRCGFVFYIDPKVAVGTIIRSQSQRLVLVRRAIDPGFGKWVFPGGYVDRGETLPVAAVREAREECGLDVRLDGLVNIYSYAGRTPVIVVYAATAIGGTLVGDDECFEACEFEHDALPWGDLAFRSTAEGLRDYLAGLLHPVQA
jgi:8-oxo-dGTP diphosphatase